MKTGCVVTRAELSLAREAGFDYVEMSGRALCAMAPEELRALRGELCARGLPLLGLNAYCPPEIRIAGPGYSKKAAREYALLCAERAGELSVRVVGVGSPMSRNLPEGFDRETAFHQAQEFFTVTAQAFAPAGITVCVEALGPCYCNFINRLGEAQRLARAVSLRNLKVVLDFYNMEHSGEADIPLSPFLPDIFHAHISDDAGSPRRRWFLTPEKAQIHTARVRRLLRAGYGGDMTLEIDLPMELNAARQSLALLREAAGDICIHPGPTGHKEE